eukprot:CAMPEP_0113473984 /NCGR_PEP_ID=MMETSP0014_2-20120614/18337_1 /TAXON_ID=2857 /ORGANISM="Nitzschia sp." /LENGTH=318 /DNA_ID=CAMNT_0000366791 /DNA_START=420 /DNA_END=1372 /DNA_ORIENTATION=- /assembly_acc=CAM_ASM_000159
MDHQTVESSSCFFSADGGSRRHGHGGSIEHTTTTTTKQPQQTESNGPPRPSRRNIQRICIFELPYDWDLQNLPPTVHGGGGGGGGREQRSSSSPSLQHHNEGGDSMDQRRKKKNEYTTNNKMWCKSYITTSCDMDDDDLSSLGLDVEEYDFNDGEGPSIGEDDDDDVDFFFLDKEQRVKLTNTEKRSVSSLWRKLTFGRRRSTTTRRGQVGVAAPVSFEKSNQGSNNGVRGSRVPSTSSLSTIFDIITLSTFSMNLSGSTRSNKRGDHDEVDREDSTDRKEDDSLSVETFTSYRWTSPSTQGRPQHQQKEQHTTSKPR